MRADSTHTEHTWLVARGEWMEGGGVGGELSRDHAQGRGVCGPYSRRQMMVYWRKVSRST